MQYDNCFGALYALNGLLPKEYRVHISTPEYEKKVNLDVQAKCPKCDQATDYKNIQIKEALLPLTTRIITEHETEKIWICPSCTKINPITKTVMVQPVLQEPFYIKVVPRPPEQKDGLQGRSGFHRKMSQWVWTLIDELESQMAQFRDDNWHKGNEEMYDIDTEIEGGEENDA